MIRLFRWTNDNQLMLDSDDYPDDVFANHKLTFDWRDGTVKINDTIYDTDKKGIWYYLPFDVLDKNWINKGGYRIVNVYYPKRPVPFNPSGNPDNIWMVMYSKTTNNIIYPNAVILYKYDINDQIIDYFRVAPKSAREAQTKAQLGNYDDSVFKLYTGGGVM